MTPTQKKRRNCSLLAYGGLPRNYTIALPIDITVDTLLVPYEAFN